jgi:hypothetical protein
MNEPSIIFVSFQSFGGGHAHRAGSSQPTGQSRQGRLQPAERAAVRGAGLTLRQVLRGRVGSEVPRESLRCFGCCQRADKPILLKGCRGAANTWSFSDVMIFRSLEWSISGAFSSCPTQGAREHRTAGGGDAEASRTRELASHSTFSGTRAFFPA